jgi:exonuclease VII small subunit
MQEEEYRRGFIDGLKCFAFWKDGVQYIGTCGTTLAEAVEQVDFQWNYSPKGDQNE